MYIPKQMANKITKVFYDKNISILKSMSTIDVEGAVTYKGYEVVNEFKGNVNVSNCKKIQEEYGLDYNIDISITTNYELVNINDIIQYQDVRYNVTDVLKHDSHSLIVATKWQ